MFSELYSVWYKVRKGEKKRRRTFHEQSTISLYFPIHENASSAVQSQDEHLALVTKTAIVALSRPIQLTPKQTQTFQWPKFLSKNNFDRCLQRANTQTHGGARY